ncbi:MAG: hypothetical protein KDA88_10760 [Planctomycetaceae bacterium]|nr:hypothetical protein [Planctomycetaceae bacterium]MCB9953512.1 hypothetical protein [Planctomycetaceae bacterium]
MILFAALIVLYKLISYPLHGRLVKYVLAIRAISPQLKQVAERHKNDFAERSKQRNALVDNAGIDRIDLHLMHLADFGVFVIAWGILGSSNLLNGASFAGITNVATFSWMAVIFWINSSILVRYVQNWAMNIDSIETFSAGVGCLLAFCMVPVFFFRFPAYVFLFWTIVNACTLGWWGWHVILASGSGKSAFPTPGQAPPAPTPQQPSHRTPAPTPQPHGQRRHSPAPSPVPQSPRPVPQQQYTPTPTPAPVPHTPAVPTAYGLSDTSVPVINVDTTPGKSFELQHELGRAQVGQTIDFDPPGTIITGPIKFHQKSPVTVDGQGGTIWSTSGPVVVIESGEVVLQSLTIAVIGKTPSATATLETAIEVKPGARVTLRDVTVVGKTQGLATNEEAWRLPGQLDLGTLKPGTQKFKLRLAIGEDVTFVSDLAGLSFDPSYLPAGAHEVDVTLPDLYDGTRLRGMVLLKSSNISRKFDVIGRVNTNGKDWGGKIIWEPADWSTVSKPAPPPLPPKAAQPPPTPAKPPAQPQPPKPVTSEPTKAPDASGPTNTDAATPAPASNPPEIPKKRNVVKSDGLDESVFG